MLNLFNQRELKNYINQYQEFKLVKLNGKK